MNLLLKSILFSFLLTSAVIAQDHRDHGGSVETTYPNPPVVCKDKCIGYEHIGTPMSENGLSSYIRLERDGVNLRIVFRNEVTTQPRDITFFKIEDVQGYIENGPGDQPDYLTVRPPIGWWCDPCSIIANDGDISIITLFPEVGA